jgi:microcystin-dependent protein
MDAYLGEIRAFAFSYAPRNWMPCNGQTLSIAQYSALYSILGTQYGGNGTTTFQLPNLSGRATMSQGQGPGLSAYSVGDLSGEEAHTLVQSEMPAHVHQVHGKVETGGNTGLKNVPAGNTYLSRLTSTSVDPDVGYTRPPLATPVTLAPTTIGAAGNGMPHENRQPMLPLMLCICFNGEFPSRN